MSERDKLERAIATLEAQRSALGSSVVETATAEMRQKLAALGSLTTDKRKRVTVLFADVSGFTALSERLDPEEVQALLTKLWRRLDRAITAQRGHIDKHIGDAVMAVWGLSEARADDAEHAVRAALAMQAELEQFRAAESVSLGMRVGVNTGLASLSHVESTGEVNLIGDAVNLASRLEHAAEVGSVLLGPATVEQVRERFELQPLPPLTLKGKAEPVHAAQALRERPRATRLPTHTLSGAATKTVGRDAELGKLLSAYQRARDGTATWITITGDAGIGKSRLLSDFDAMLHLQGDRLLVLRVPCWPEDERLPFRTLRRLLERIAGLPEGAPAPKVMEALQRAFEPTLEADAAEGAALLARLAGLTEGADNDIGPDQLRGRGSVLLRRHLARTAAERLVVVELDDVHHADAGSAELLTSALSPRERQRLLVIASARDPVRALPGQALALTPLSRAASEALVHDLLSNLPSPPAWLIARVVDGGGGNPHFMEELVRWLIRQGVVDASTTPWYVTREIASDASLPSRVEALLAERLERLSDAERSLLGCAAVIGQTFWPGALSAMSDGPIDDLLSQLEEDGVIVKSPTSAIAGQIEYAFQSALLRDVTYEYTLLRTRRAHHGRLAAWLAERAPDDAATIAAHFAAAEDGERAAHWYAAAAERAHERGAPEVAIAHYDAALKHGEGDRALCARCHAGRGKALYQRGRYTDALRSFDALRSLAAVLGDARLQAAAHNGASWCHGQAGSFEHAVSEAARAETIVQSAARAAGALEPELRSELTDALVNRAWAELMLGRTAAAEAAARETLRLTEGETSNARALAYNVLGVAGYHLQANYDEAARYLEQSLALQRRRGDRWGIACQLNNLGDLARVRGDHRSALALAEETLSIAEDIDDRGMLVTARTNIGCAHLGLGNPERAERHLRTAVEAATALGETSAVMAEAARFLAEALAAQGRGEEAFRHALRSLELADAEKRPELVGAGWRTLGNLLSGRTGPGSTVVLRPRIEALGRSVDAEECFAQSLRTFIELGLAREQLQTYVNWAEYESDRGEFARARELSAQANALRARAGGGSFGGST